MEYLILAALLAGFIALLTMQIKKNKKLNERYEQEKAAIKEEHKASLETAVTSYKTKHQEEMKNLHESHQTEIKKHQTEIEKLKKERQSYRNRGEIITHDVLNSLRDRLIDNGILKADEMIIMPNIFIPDRDGNSRQLDHLVLLPQGLYLIETKYWRGHIVLGMTKDNCGTKFSFLPKILDSSKEETLVFNKVFNKDVNKDGPELSVKNYGDPIAQVSTSARILSNYIKSKIGLKVWADTLVFFNHEEKKVYNWSSNNDVTIVKDKTELFDHLGDQILTKNKKYNATKLNEIKTIIENANYIS